MIGSQHGALVLTPGVHVVSIVRRVLPQATSTAAEDVQAFPEIHRPLAGSMGLGTGTHASTAVCFSTTALCSEAFDSASYIRGSR